MIGSCKNDGDAKESATLSFLASCENRWEPLYQERLESESRRE